MYKGGNHIALTEQDKKLLEEYERITERNVISITIDEEKKSLDSYPEYGTQYATIEIPRIGANLPVYFGDTLEILKKGVGHSSGSYFPGEGGSILYMGHNSKKVFRRFSELQIGDEIKVTTTYGEYNYKIYDMQLIKADKKSISDVLVISMIEDSSKSIEIANELRKAGINTEIYFDNKKMKAKFKYADRLNIPYVLVIGEDEIKTGMYTIKDMANGTQEQMEIEKIIEKLK